MPDDNPVGDGGNQDPEADFEDVLSDESESEETEDAESDNPDDSDSDSGSDSDDSTDEEDSEESESVAKSKKSDSDSDDDDLGSEELDSDLEDIQGRVSFRDLKAKYPKIFKEVPALRHALNREREYSELFPTVEDAKTAASAADNVQQFEAQLLAGVSMPMLATMAQNKPESFVKFSQGFLPSLKEISPKAYYSVVTPALVEALSTVQDHAKAVGSRDLATSVQNISRVLFKSENLPDLKFNAAPKLEESAQGPSERERQLLQRQFENFQEDLADTTMSQVRRKIAKDPEVLKIKDPSYREYVISQIMSGADDLMKRDPLYQRTLKSFRKRIQAGDMSPATKKQIVLAYLRRVESFKGPVMKKVLQSSGGRPAARPADKKKFRPSSETQAKAKTDSGSRSGNQPKLHGSVKDDVKFLSS